MDASDNVENNGVDGVVDEDLLNDVVRVHVTNNVVDDDVAVCRAWGQCN